MYVCFAFLLDYEIHNSVRKIIYKIINEHHVGIESSLLPQHVSLKQSFYVSDISEVEDYFEQFALSLKPINITFSTIDIINMGNIDNETQVLWLDIKESQSLRDIHNKLNTDLMNLFSIPMSGFDGDTFHFHSTLTYGYNQYKELTELKNIINTNLNEVTFNVREVAMFYSVDEQVRPGRFITHKILPIK